MSGNLWMFSDMLDDEDIEMQKHDFRVHSAGSGMSELQPVSNSTNTDKVTMILFTGHPPWYYINSNRFSRVEEHTAMLDTLHRFCGLQKRRPDRTDQSCYGF